MSRTSLIHVPALLGILVLLSGCGGSYGPGDSNYPDYRTLTLALRVQDPDGNPIANARVFVDGDRYDWPTQETFEPLGTDFPAAWQGWLANWSSSTDFFEDTPGEPIHFDIAVRKTGWGEGVSIVHIESPTSRYYVVRDTITLYPGGTNGSPEPQYAEFLPSPTGPSFE
ncbi:MAG: hypothetical protein ABFD96_22880 [Armatimonadia bacterium]